MCFNCLKAKHRAAKCRKKLACRVNRCTYFHHKLKLLHVTKKDRDGKQESESSVIEHFCYQEEPMARVLSRAFTVTLIGRNDRIINKHICTKG